MKSPDGVCEGCGGPAFNARWGSPQRYCSDPCRMATAKSRRLSHYLAVQRAGERRRQLNKFGMTPKEYDRLLQNQNGKCAICGSEPGRRQLAVDHDHETGEVRGLLCSNCNTGLGLLGDQLARLRVAVTYLEGR